MDLNLLDNQVFFPCKLPIFTIFLVEATYLFTLVNASSSTYQNNVGGPPEGPYVVAVMQLNSTTQEFTDDDSVAQMPIELNRGATYLFIANTTCDYPIYISSNQNGGGLDRVDDSEQFYNCEGDMFTFTPTDDMPTTLYYQTQFFVRTGGKITLNASAHLSASLLLILIQLVAILFC